MMKKLLLFIIVVISASQLMAQPLNDECLGAITLTPGVYCAMSTYTTINATASTSEITPTCGNYAGGDVWFKVIVPASGALVFNTLVSSSGADASMAIYSGMCGALAEIECNDNFGDNINPTIINSSLIPGSTVYIRYWLNGSVPGSDFQISVSASDLQPPCTNLGFENGFNGWIGSLGNSKPGLTGALTPNYIPELLCAQINSDSNLQLMTGGNDPYGGFPCVYSGTYSLRIGDDAVTTNNEIYNAASARQTFLVDAGNTNLAIHYAAVLQDGGHVDNQQPFLSIEFFNQNGMQLTTPNFIVTVPYPGFILSPTGANVYYKPWTQLNVDLTNYIGQYITVRFTTSDCEHVNLGGHFGYAYIDCSCGSNIEDVSGSSTCHLPYLAILNTWDPFVMSEDTILYQINFGDGSDTTFNMIFQGNPSPNVSVTHIYDSAGIYSPSAILQHTDGLSDTIYAPNLVVTSDTCGNISGTVFIDTNLNCILDNNEFKLANILVKLFDLSHTFLQAQFTDANGLYTFSVPNGNYLIEIDSTIYNNFTMTCPSSGNYNISSFPATDKNFGLDCTSGFDLYGYLDGSIGILGVNPVYINLHIGNLRSAVTNANVKLILDSLATYGNYSNIPPSAINGDTISWLISNLYTPGHTDVNINLNVTIASGFQIGDIIHFCMEVSPINGDFNPLNNTQCKNVTLILPFDPNEKIVSPEGDITVNTPLTYTIHFQNTGTATANNVFILDTLDANLNLNTLELQSASHNYNTEILHSGQKNILKFLFPNINLPDSSSSQMLSRGYISYKINPFTTLVEGTLLNNTAEIYFDFNPAIATNTVQSKIVKDVYVEQSATIANNDIINPNPTNGQTTLNYYISEKGRTLITIFDITGKKIRTLLDQQVIPGTHQLNLNVEELNAGIYFIKINSSNHVSILKLVKIGK